jgi:hypothetical protein
VDDKILFFQFQSLLMRWDSGFFWSGINTRSLKTTSLPFLPLCAFFLLFRSELNDDVDAVDLRFLDLLALTVGKRSATSFSKFMSFDPRVGKCSYISCSYMFLYYIRIFFLGGKNVLIFSYIILINYSTSK